MTKTYQMRCIEQDRGASLESIIRAGIEGGQSWDRIATELGVSRLTLREWARRLGCRIETKRTVEFASEARAQ